MDIDNTLKIMLKGVADHTATDDIVKKLKTVQDEKRPLRIKLGLDPSAPDIHLGHAVVLRKIKQMQDLGHEAIIIIGDFTGMIGDPSGKSKTRKPLTREQVVENAKTYESQVFKVLDKSKTTLLFNSDWLGKMTFKEVIELAAKTTVARLLERDEFKKRYDTNQPISVHEFFYPLMQAYDSVHVKADIELGGTDQTFNILMGRNIQKDFNQEPQITLFMPLLEGLDGIEKMSKSLGNYIGVNEPANVMYEKAMKIPDELIMKYYNLCTDIHPDDIQKIKERLDKGENPRDIKMELAREITALYHSKEAALAGEDHFKTAYQKGVAPADADVLEFAAPVDANALMDALVATGKYKSKSDLRRLFQQGAVKINDEKATDVKQLPAMPNGSVIQIGKGQFFRVSVKD
ncbi:MAG: tyrosine--tRNA ligase [Lactobacillales bacterium]|nr:tyrosine--tRNA ligase [Lactobacillales bacterium]